MPPGVVSPACSEAPVPIFISLLRLSVLPLDQDTQGTTGSPDLVQTIFGKIEKSEVVIQDVTIVGKTDEDEGLINSNVAIELG